jgi:hypothetical protein
VIPTELGTLNAVSGFPSHRCVTNFPTFPITTVHARIFPTSHQILCITDHQNACLVTVGRAEGRLKRVGVDFIDLDRDLAGSTDARDALADDLQEMIRSAIDRTSVDEGGN